MLFMEMTGRMEFKTRDRVIKTLKKWSGKLIEPKYTKIFPLHQSREK